jgi:BlaI family transcriptional regulator, penicillinase repressor
MPRRPSPTLTPAELRVMQALWKLERASATAIVESLAGSTGSRDSTVRTILRILERKGFVKHERDGRAFIYLPAVAEGEAQRGAVRDLVTRFFGNSPERLVLNLLKHEEVDSRELQRLRRLVDREDSE